MTRPNPNFDLTVEDMDLIETALQQSRNILSDRQMTYEFCADLEGTPDREKARRVGETLGRIQQLLGRLNTQKAVCGAAAGAS
ncbi:hypothetical protein [Leisingera sp. S232]|uniref:hypothetical protein n=1 Tax=Leisingera sp. S232 TaxID=3415132 RepID=UPI00086E06BA|nr:hypothetical protein AB838_05405 [Rhodobacteraceae bacterium (ex Bugula neritina AB1)]